MQCFLAFFRLAKFLATLLQLAQFGVESNNNARKTMQCNLYYARD